MTNPLICERCGGELESDDAVSIIEGVCGWCRRGEPRPVRRTAVAPRVVIQQGDPPLPDPADEVRQDRSAKRRRDLAIGVVVGLVVTAGVTGYVVNRPSGPASVTPTVSRVPVTLTVAPPTATVRLDGEKIGPADEQGHLTFLLPAEGVNMHWLEADAGGYHPIRQPISAQGDRQDLHLTLVRKPFDMAVRSDPVGAEVWLDDELKGYTPLTLTTPPVFSGRLQVKRLGYLPAVQQVEPPPAGEDLRFDFELRAAAPVIQVESDPPGAKVVVDGKTRGVAPVKLELGGEDWGDTVTVVASMEGRKEVHRDIVLPSEPGEIHPVRFSLAEAAIEVQIHTKPAGGRIIVDGRPVGTAPVVATFPTERFGRTAVIEAVQPGSRYGKTRIILPVPGESADVMVSMRPHGRRVVFAFACPDGRTNASFLLADRTVEQLHQLRSTQRFALLAWIDDGVEAWPGETDLIDATAEQKVRAYDWVRSTRSAGRVDVARLYTDALAFEPDVVWLCLPAGTDWSSLRRLGPTLAGRRVSINVLTTSIGPADDWVGNWTAERGGTLTVIGRAMPILAGDIGQEE